MNLKCILLNQKSQYEKCAIHLYEHASGKKQNYKDKTEEWLPEFREE